jgi:hypothetical protein
VTVPALQIHEGIRSEVEAKGVRWIEREFCRGDDKVGGDPSAETFLHKASAVGIALDPEVRNNPSDFILLRNPLEADGLVNVLGLASARGLTGKSALIATDEATASAAHRWELNCSRVNAEAFHGI